MKTSYRERDYAFGEKMLQLRTQIGLTQAGLASSLGLSRHAVGEWEAGNSYPKVQSLKEFIALGVKQQAFTAKHEVEEIRALWKAACQKVLLDERWLSSLLEHSCSPHLYLVPKAVEESMESRLVDEQGCRDSARFLSGDKPRQVPPASGTLVHWGDALAIPTFYGREQEMAQLTQWIVQDRSRVVSVLGMGGIGKSALSVSTIYQLAVGTAACPCPFEVIILHSLRDAPAFETLLNDCLQVLSPQSLGTVPANLEQRLSLLLSHLRTQRVLLVLDNLECLLQEGDVRGCFRPGFEGYGQLLRRVAETAHQSCLLITSRERPADLRALSGKFSLVRSLRLSGLDVTACKQLFVEKEVVGTEADQERLISLYGGNPLALKVVAETILDLFGGEIGAFLAGEIVIFGSVTDLLSEQFARLGALEQSVLCWLSIAREPVTLDKLLAVLVLPLPRSQVLEAVDSLRRRSLIEPGKGAGSFTLQSVVLEYVTAHLVASASHEIQQHRLDRLIKHGLSQAYAKEYVRQTQQRLLLSPLLIELQSLYTMQADKAIRTCSVEEQLLSLLDHLRKLDDSVHGYGPANLTALLRLLRGHLSGLDLSQLSLRGAYLQGVEMHDTSLSGAFMRDTVWTSAISAPWNVAISQDGALWAAASMQGEMRVWREGGRTLHLYFQAHNDIVYALAFSPNGRMLASASIDGTVKLWDVGAISCSRSPCSALLWVGRQNSPYNLAFSPDSSLLASCGMEAAVCVFDTQSGTNLHRLDHPAAVRGVTWSPDGKLLASSCFDGQLRLWERRETSPSTGSEHFRLSTSWEMSPAVSLAFAPDGQTLASAGWDQKIRLWEVESGRLLHTFEGETNMMSRVAWSPDGRTLAGCSYEKTIHVFDVAQRRHLLTLLGHTFDVADIAFTPDSQNLLSGSTDGGLRVWDVQSGECVRVIQGYAVSLYGLDWSPDSTCLVSGGTDGCVSIWKASGESLPGELYGHTWTVSGAGWSPDGRCVASSGWDMTIRMWDPASHTSVQTFADLAAPLTSLAWSPDGSELAAGTLRQGMYVWDVREGVLRWVGERGQAVFFSVAWSPDGSLLAGGGEDGSIYLWKSADGTLQERLQGHHGHVMSIAWSPDGTRLASGSAKSGKGELFVWNVQAETRDRANSHPLSLPARSGASYPDMVYAVAWSPHADQLISGGSDGLLRWWDVDSGECVFAQMAHQGTIRSHKVSPNGKFLASCGWDGALMIWDLNSHEHIRTLRRDRPYERLNIAGIRGLTEAEITSLRVLGAMECDAFDQKA